MEKTKSYDSLLELVKKRRSTRQFNADPVPEEYVTRILEVARWAPSGFHTQPWEFVVVRDKVLKNKIAGILERFRPPIMPAGEAAPRQGSFRDAPVYIILLGDPRARVGLPDSVQNNEARVTEILCSSLASTFLYMHLAAAALGLASQWYSASADPQVEAAIKELIGIPAALKIYDLMVLGYPAATPVPKIVRHLDDMVHYDDCGVGDFRTDEEVAAGAKKTREWCMSAH